MSDVLEGGAMGDQPYVIAGKVMIQNADGRFLFIRRSQSSNHFKAQWEMPGGKMDPGETLSDCLIRETKEETGLDIAIDHVMGAAEGDIPAYRLAYLFLSAHVVGSEVIRLSDEHDDFKWVTPEEALDLDLCPAFVPFINELSKREPGD